MAQGWLPGRDPAYALQLQRVGGFLGEAQVAEMYRVERAAKERLAMPTPDPREIQVIQARPALSGKGTPP